MQRSSVTVHILLTHLYKFYFNNTRVQENV